MHTVFHISDCLEGKQVISLEHLLLESCISLAKYQICLTAYAFFSILFEVYICILYFPIQNFYGRVSRRLKVIKLGNIMYYCISRG